MTGEQCKCHPIAVDDLVPLGEHPGRAMDGCQLPAGVSFVEGGGVTSALGFKAAGVHAGFRKNPERFDMALVVADQPCACAGTFTQNVFCAAPVVASTGVIGQHLPLDPFKTGVPAALSVLSRDGGNDAARAIMTTDTHPKEAAVAFTVDDPAYEGIVFTVGGMAKGSGMIMPNMATMISVLSTDAPLTADVLHGALVAAVGKSFNKVTVDSDTSTNDSCFLLASGAAAPGAPSFAPGSAAYAAFEGALQAVCINLARQMAEDGEGATRLVTVNVTGAANAEDADRAARTVANSPLVKTAITGHDANWGRIAGAIGRSGATLRQQDAAIDIMGLPVCRGGLTVPFDEDEALRRFEQPEIVIDIDLGAGDAATTMWTCDFSHEYITINGDYRT